MSTIPGFIGANKPLNEVLNIISIDYDIEVGNDYAIGALGDNQGL